MRIPRIDPRNALGLLDKVVGLGKEIAGNAVGRDRLIKAGQTQQDKGTERLKAVESELRARKHEVKANAAERTQRSAQKTKEAVNS
jgi:uncharacterized protein YjbJ (UPF0337 family)